MADKIATCCYCGSRTVLQLRGKTQHELSCRTCGAALHDMKMLKIDRVLDRPTQSPARPVRSFPAATAQVQPKKSKKKKRKKTLGYRLIKEAFDAIEDIFD